MYQAQLAEQNRLRAEQDPMRMAQIALLGSQGEKMRQEARFERARADVGEIQAMESDPMYGTRYMNPGGMHIGLIPYFGPEPGAIFGAGPKGGGGGTAAPLENNVSMAEEDAKKKKGRAEAAMYDSMVSGDTYVGPGAGWGATYSSPSYNPSSGSRDSW
jgi:hypothetical protein